MIIGFFLRFIYLDKVPVSLFGDELDVGYQAYSILTTGKDYMGNFMPIHFESLAEYRTPLYLYTTVPTVALFGITPLGVRLPSVILGVLSIYLLYLLVKELSGDERVALLSAVAISLSPWHIHYSRTGFEVSEMILLLLLGIWSFLKGLRKPNYLILASVSLGLLPWVYSTAKLFLPLILILILALWWRELQKLPRKALVACIMAFMLVIIPITWSTLFAGGAERFGSISILADKTIEPSIGFERLADAKRRDPNAANGVAATLPEKLLHNKVTYLGNVFLNNYLTSFSSQFLFTKGDHNPRHSIQGMGVMYKIDFVFLLLGLIVFFISAIPTKIKLFIIGWLLLAPIPAALTDQGGDHATRLILMLPPLLILVSFGLSKLLSGQKSRSLMYLARVGTIGTYLISFIFFVHQYLAHYPIESERWWHAGIKEAIIETESLADAYDRVIISQADEPLFKFFLSYAKFPPQELQERFPQKEDLAPFGKVRKLDKFYFTSEGDGIGLYELGTKLPVRTLYLATQKEIVQDLKNEPSRVPADLKLIKVFTQPSGMPIFYLFSSSKTD